MVQETGVHSQVKSYQHPATPFPWLLFLLGIVTIEKEAFGLPLTMVSELTKIYIYLL